MSESAEIAKILEQGSGADASLTSLLGWHESKTPIMLMFIPRMAYAYLSAKVKSQVTVPVIASVRDKRSQIGKKKYYIR